MRAPENPDKSSKHMTLLILNLMIKNHHDFDDSFILIVKVYISKVFPTILVIFKYHDVQTSFKMNIVI